MTKVDRLGWAAGISVAPYGVEIGIRVSEPESLRVVEQLVAEFGWKKSGSGLVSRLFSVRFAPVTEKKSRRHYHLLYLNASRLERTLVRSEVLDKLRVSLLDVAMLTAKDNLFVLGGIIHYKGRRLALPFHPSEGECVLAKELLKRGGRAEAERAFPVLKDNKVQQLDAIALPVPASFQAEPLGTLSSGRATGLLFSFALEPRANSARSLSLASKLAAQTRCLGVNAKEPQRALEILEAALGIAE